MEALDNFSPVMWTNSVRHCEDLISGDWRREMGTYTLENIPPIIITLADSDNESLSFSSDSSDDDFLRLISLNKDTAALTLDAFLRMMTTV
jgi:hypothetical protein